MSPAGFTSRMSATEWPAQSGAYSIGTVEPEIVSIPAA